MNPIPPAIYGLQEYGDTLYGINDIPNTLWLRTPTNSTIWEFVIRTVPNPTMYGQVVYGEDSYMGFTDATVWETNPPPRTVWTNPV